MKKLGFILLATAFFATSCKKDNDNKGGIFKGPEVQVHDGKAWTWVQLDKSGNPERLAITVNDAALNSLPVGGDDHSGHDHSGENNWILPFHPKAGATAFDHIGLDWNPAGHEPEPVYGKPHFDFHFYMISSAAVAAIPPYEVDSLKFKNWPAPEYLPANYINPGGGVPQMGAHWIDFTSPELNGQPFTQTFIYGSFDGKVNFYEPMITLEFIKTANNFERSIPQPAKVQKSSYYPTKMRIEKHDGLNEIILEGFVYRTQA
ncbi:DUF5602 domain-containing protein [Flavihumibacter fluvii]|jgi:Domain of unknown function (DUF5602)|uniref:DUF5602 domain-containing protein n=1 Tax=Flavihumibacter fluvii TaxID=2838157 RepID=UPI001BDDF7A6|nr:DUF5602 domain-containing protein [Flavihumibacter fluvii]ULQ53015.1 DUF5602 domain-containing protein [Flavihumibacter fluvii]